MTCRQLLFCILLFFLGIHNIFCATCTYTDNSNYKLDWVVESQTGQIHFVLEYYNFPSGVSAWTGVAFGDSMYSGLDAVVVKVLNGQIYVSDEYVQGYQPSWPTNHRM
uniref:DOMON domain-containing protein n=1 Tax=Ditylenchus dipsaci TaxID=166011 RepID=A0A915D250_9BILA